MLQRILASFGYERRSEVLNPAFEPGNWARAVSPGGYVSPAAVLSNVAVAARCVALRSELLASVELKLYRKLSNGNKERVIDSPLAMVLHDLANPLMTAFECREFLVRSLDLHGNAYARIVRDGAGQVTEIWPVNPSMVTVERLESGRLRYRMTLPYPDRTVVLLQEDVLHIRASSEDGLIGRSPIAIARGVLSRAIAENITAYTGAANSHRIAGVVSIPNQKIAPASRTQIEQMFTADAMHANDPRSIKVLEGGAKFQPVSFSSADAEFLASRQLSNEDTARIFNVTPAAAGLIHATSYGSADADARALVQNCLQPLAERVEQAFMRCLLTPEGRRQYMIQHDLKSLLRGNMAERFAAYRIGREIGMYSVNDLRRAEAESMIEDGDEYLKPLALAGSSTPRTDPNTE